MNKSDTIKTVIVISVIVFFFVVLALNMSPAHKFDLEIPQGLIEQGSQSRKFFTKIRIDGCQYIMWNGVKKFGMTHKGNCDNHPAKPSPAAHEQ